MELGVRATSYTLVDRTNRDRKIIAKRKKKKKKQSTDRIVFNWAIHRRRLDVGNGEHVDRVDRYTTNKSEDLSARMATWGELVPRSHLRRAAKMARNGCFSYCDCRGCIPDSRQLKMNELSARLCIFASSHFVSASALGAWQLEFVPLRIFNRVKWI